VRKVGWVLVGIGFLGAAAGQYVAYRASLRTEASAVGIGVAVIALSLAIVGLLLVQFRS
jgi:hypothetical protein